MELLLCALHVQRTLSPTWDPLLKVVAIAWRTSMETPELPLALLVLLARPFLFKQQMLPLPLVPAVWRLLWALPVRALLYPVNQVRTVWIAAQWVTVL